MMSKHAHARPGSTIRSTRWLGLTALVTLALGGCYKVNYRTGLPAGGDTKSAKVTHFLWGAAGGGDTDLASMCPGGVSSVQTQNTFIDMLLTTITGHLYAPTSLVIECAGSEGASASAAD